MFQSERKKSAVKSIKSSSFANSKVYSTSYQADSFPIEERKKNEVKENLLSLYIKAYFWLISNFFVDIFFKVLFFAIFNVFVELWWIPYRPILIYIFCFISICLYWKSIRSPVISEKLSPIYNKRLKKRTKENYFLLTFVVAFLISL